MHTQLIHILGIKRADTEEYICNACHRRLRKTETLNAVVDNVKCTCCNRILTGSKTVLLKEVNYDFSYVAVANLLAHDKQYDSLYVHKTCHNNLQYKGK